MAVKVGSFAKKADGTGTQAITSVGFQGEVLLLWTAAVTSADSFAADAILSFGMATGASNSASVGIASEDNTNEANSATSVAAVALTIVDPDQAVLAQAALVSFDADGFTLNWTTNDANADIIHYAVLGGVTLTNAKIVAWSAPLLTGDQAVGGVGFVPDCVLHLWSGLAAAGQGAPAQLGIGAMTTSAQWYYYHRDRDGYMTGYGLQFVDDVTCIYSATDAGSNNSLAVYKSMDADGFTVTWNDAPAAAYLIYSLCLKGGSYKVGTFQAANTGSAPLDQGVTAPNFQPEGILAFGVPDDTVNGILGNSCSVTIGATDGTAEQVAGIRSNPADPTDTSRIAMTDKWLLITSTNADTITHEADIKSLDLTGWTHTFTTFDDCDSQGTDMIWPYLALIGGTARVDATVTVPDAMTVTAAAVAASGITGGAGVTLPGAMTATGAMPVPAGSGGALVTVPGAMAASAAMGAIGAGGVSGTQRRMIILGDPQQILYTHTEFAL